MLHIIENIEYKLNFICLDILIELLKLFLSKIDDSK